MKLVVLGLMLVCLLIIIGLIYVSIKILKNVQKEEKQQRSYKRERQLHPHLKQPKDSD